MSSGIASLRMPPAVARWAAARTMRERGALAALAVLLAALLGWFAVWQPLQRDLASLQVAVPAERRALVSARRMVDEMAALSRNAPAPRAVDARAELERIVAERGLRPALTEISWQDERARLVFADVSLDALVPFLDALARDARLTIREATLTARVEPGTVRAEITLAR
jgi:type II secretory pathway component PulM